MTSLFTCPPKKIINETKTVFIVSIYSKEIGFTQQHPRFECSHQVVDQPRWSWELNAAEFTFLHHLSAPVYP